MLANALLLLVDALLVLVNALLVLVNALLVLVNALLVLVSASLVLASALLVPVSACKVTQIGKACLLVQMQPSSNKNHRQIEGKFGPQLIRLVPPAKGRCLEKHPHISQLNNSIISRTYPESF